MPSLTSTTDLPCQDPVAVELNELLRRAKGLVGKEAAAQLLRAAREQALAAGAEVAVEYRAKSGTFWATTPHGREWSLWQWWRGGNAAERVVALQRKNPDCEFQLVNLKEVLDEPAA